MKSERGISLVEIVFAALILGVVAAASMRAFLFMSRQSVRTGDRAFATQKAIQMMEELRGLISDSGGTVGVLDDYDNGGGDDGFKYTLSTRSEVNGTLGGGENAGDRPGDPLSGNPDKKFKRRVTVNQVDNEPLARRVYVRVYKSDTGEVLAETVSVLRTTRNVFYPSQVYDVFVLVLENVPGWWVSMSTMKPMFDGVVQDLQQRNPGLVFRTHYITRLAYGRDPYYAPFTNDEIKANQHPEIRPLMQVYFYPGLVDKSGADFHYYVPSDMDGRRNVDGVLVDSASYSMADQYNHAVRYPDEERLYKDAVAAALADGRDPPEISYRMLIERMSAPGTDSATGRTYDYRNAILLNMHGELVPLPPMRNFSDAAKDPQDNPEVRVVAHPENLAYGAGNQVRLRVYSYYASPHAAAGIASNPVPVDDATGHDQKLSSLSIVVASTQVLPANISVRKMLGNRDEMYGWTDALSGTDYTVTPIGSTATMITLFNSPLRAQEWGTSNSYGLEDRDRLYGMEYIPSLLDGATYFIESTTAPQVNHRDLADNTDDRPKNTARWVVRIDGLPTGRHDFHTRIGTNLADGVSQKLSNLSRTYAWVGVSVPYTERFQFLGDPRHMPYADVKTAGRFNGYFNNPAAVTSGGSQNVNNGLNTGFDAGDYPGFTGKTDRWGGRLNIDVPRFFQVLRSAVINGHGLWSSITGFSSYYVGLGGEMGYDASNGFNDSLPVIATPWDPTDTTSTNETVQEIIWDNGTHRNARLISNTSGSWWGLHWLGELYPDSAYTVWSTTGNLPVGAGNYYRRDYGDVRLSSVIKRTESPGCASFFNGNPTGGNGNWFMHSSWNSGEMADLQAAGGIMASDFTFPLVATIRSRRPFQLASTSNPPPEWNLGDYPGLRTTLSTKELWYKRPGFNEDTSSLVRMVYGGNAGGAVMNGVDTQTDFGSVQIAKLCVVGLLRGFMLLGEPSVSEGNIPQVPLVSISSPAVTDEFNDPSSISVRWDTAWTRWDSQAYTASYPSPFTPAVAVDYNVKYSNDNGQNWYFAGTTVPVEPGFYDDDYSVSAPYSWPVPSSDFPTGNYLIRVECFRPSRPLHYSYHQRRVFIRR